METDRVKDRVCVRETDKQRGKMNRQRARKRKMETDRECVCERERNRQT
jgi:hypothetical protein